MPNRKTIKLLPEYNQTTTLSKQFSATVDHLFQPEDVEFLNAYVGSTPSYWNPDQDFYIGEPNKTRVDYQLSVAAASVDVISGKVNNILFYDDLINQLRYQGANVSNHSRLFSQEYYSWSPPINLDKLINYNQYFWLPQGPGTITLLDTTDAFGDIQGQRQFTYSGAYRIESTGVEINGDLKFSSGLRIRFSQDVDTKIINQEFTIENVGRSIILYLPSGLNNASWDTVGWDTSGWDGDSANYIPNYVTIERAGRDQNRWGVTNYWYHRDVIALSGAQLLDESLVKAQRPIIEFDRNLVLYNHGSFGRGAVTLVDQTSTDFLSTVSGKTAFKLNGIDLADDQLVLVTADLDPEVNNRIYKITGMRDTGVITPVLVTNGQSASGAPVTGDSVYVTLGETTGTANTQYWFNGSNWIKAQQKQNNVSPLFKIFDAVGNALDDVSVYPGSNFQGNAIFGYKQSTAFAVDTVLGFPTALDQFGDFQFENYLVTQKPTWVFNNTITNYVGYQYAKIADATEQLTNGWYKAPTASRQYIVNQFNVTETMNSFVVDQAPALNSTGLPAVFLTRIRNKISSQLVLNQDFTVDGNIVYCDTQVGDRIQIKTWSPTTPPLLTGYYELPVNLTANPNNEEITIVSKSNFLGHFLEIIGNQFGLTGTALGTNSYRDTVRDRSLGLSILQHRAPMLKLMMLNSTSLNNITGVSESLVDPMLTQQFAQREYARFYNKFINALFDLSEKQGYGTSQSADIWISQALKKINVGKSASFAWANSGFEGNPGDYCWKSSSSPTWIPPNAARLGITRVYKPRVFWDSSYGTPQLYIETVSGAQIALVDSSGKCLGTIANSLTETGDPVLLTHPIAVVWLSFELKLYNNLPDDYRSIDRLPLVDLKTLRPGKWRTTEYNRAEILNVQRPLFDKWTIQNQLDFKANTTFKATAPWTYNYRTCRDQQNRYVPGNWRGIFEWFYDTDRPHTHPWEMLGFSQKPVWWDSEYGPAPWTSGNQFLWKDLQAGRIRQGARAGIDTNWARPGLMDCIPVDAQGNLLPPLAAGCVAGLPSEFDAAADWNFGDGSPIETVWRKSIESDFVVAQTTYLLKPASFIEYNWDTLRIENTNSEYYYVDTNQRRSSLDFYFHRENPSIVGLDIVIPNETNLTYYGSGGIQHWISEYLVSKNLSVSQYLGALLRGATVKLGHKFAGYVNTTSIRALVDSFGQVGYQSQIIPSENVNCYLYKSNSIGEFFYGGIIIKQVASGWQVLGYDSLSLSFTIIPSDKNGPKNRIAIGNQTAFEYTRGKNFVKTVSYGTIFPDQQSVFDFIISYGRYLESQGWVFDSLTDQNQINNWRQKATDFLFWSQGNWANGMTIALSPFATQAKFKQSFGNIQFINGIVSGTYPVLSKEGENIESQNLEVLREDGELIVRPTNSQAIYGLRLFVTTLEHAVLFDNTTSFQDVVYAPLYNLAQPRIKIMAYRTNGWTGRLDAPGYFLTQDTATNTWQMVPNFEKTVDDVRRYFNIEQPTVVNQLPDATDTSGVVKQQTTELAAVNNSQISNLSKHLIGYQKRDYLQNLLLEDSVEFQFYQGFIRQKGTQSVIDKLLRNTNVIPAAENFNYYEEWAFRIGDFGDTAINQSIDILLNEQDFQSNPQMITITANSDYQQLDNAAINMSIADPRIITKPDVLSTAGIFPLRTGLSARSSDTMTAGPVRSSDVQYTVLNSLDLLNLSQSLILENKAIQLQDRVWQIFDSANQWQVWQLVSPSANLIATEQTNTLSGSNTTTTLLFDGAHGISAGDQIVVSNVANVSTLNSTFIVESTTDTTVDIMFSSNGPGIGGTVGIYVPVRFSTIGQRDSYSPPVGWQINDMCWVDQTAFGNQMFVYTYSGWVSVRKQQLKPDASLIEQAKLFDKSTLNLIQTLVYWDPISGIIPGIADREITYKTEYDPAIYGQTQSGTTGAQSVWGSEQVGSVWWNLSATRWVDYTAGDDSFKWSNWGKLVPGTTLDIYEWIRSPVSPIGWANFVANSTQFVDSGITYIPDGEILNPDSPSWTEISETDSTGNTQTWYYFWVKNSTMSPMNVSRSLTTKEISTIIQNPNSVGLSWYAIISDKSFLVSNISGHLSNTDVFLQINYATSYNSANNYKQWQLVRESDPYSAIPALLWNKLRDSLVGFDKLGNQVPDNNLNDLVKLGIKIRPRQTMFKNRLSAVATWISVVNKLIAAQPLPLITNPDIVGWKDYFNAAESIDNAQWNYHVANITERNNLPIQKSLLDGDRVLVDQDPITNNLWTIYEWQSLTSSWLLVQQQAYNTANYWNLIDWYATGKDSSIIADFVVNSVSNLTDNVASVGNITKVLNDGTGLWQYYEYNGVGWDLVAQQAGSIAIDINYVGWDELPWDSGGFDVTPDIELSYIFDGVVNSILATPGTNELNTLFFAMLNYILTEQTFVDWAFKTSFIVLSGFNLPFDTSQLYSVDLTDSILNFINESKPYRAKIREFASGRTAMDTAIISTLDFDRPVLDSKLIPFDSNASVISKQYDGWQQNYVSNPSLIRNIETQLVFDRVSATSGGAATRIAEFYSPTPTQIPKDDPTLISGVAYRGTVLDQTPLNYETGWSVAPWDQFGWDATQQDIDAYIDLAIQAGVPPIYNIFYGTGTQKIFGLSYSPQDITKTVVWADGQLKEYITDWIIPASASAITIVDAGSGYTLGDKLTVAGVTGPIAIEIEVTQVDSMGAIQAVDITNAGSVKELTYVTEWAAISLTGTGTDATFFINWLANQLVFNTAPQASNKPNIYVLFAGTTFEPALTNDSDTIYDGSGLVQPITDSNHPEELFPCKVLNAVNIDCYQIAAPGACPIYSDYVDLDGSTDQFKLPFRPQNTAAVLVFHNGTMLQYGATNDYVVNFETSQLVLTHKLNTGKLAIIAFGNGGSGAGFTEIYAQTSGTNYQIGDTITIGGGIQIRPTEIQITRMQAGSVSVAFGGTGYKIGDLLIENSGETITTGISLKVTAAGVHGNVTQVEIISPGDYIQLPVITSYVTTGTGSGVVIHPDWQIKECQVLDTGLYIEPPNQLIQLSTSGTGSGATFIGLRSRIISEKHIVADGVTHAWQLTTNPTANQLQVTVDGIEIYSFVVSNNVVTLSTVPTAGSFVSIVVFDSDQFSQITDTAFVATNSIEFYSLEQQPGSNLPVYHSLLVMKNGLRVTPPPMETYFTDGIQTVFTARNSTITGVYISGKLVSNYNQVGKNIEFTIAPSSGHVLTIVSIDLGSTYNYQITSFGLLELQHVNSGDQYLVKTWKEDSQIGFITQHWTGTGTNSYELACQPWDETALMVWLNGVLLSPITDYRLIGKQLLLNGQQNINDTVIVTYNRLPPAAPAIGWRQATNNYEKIVSQVLSATNKTATLSNVFVSSSTVEIADITVLTLPVLGKPGQCWIGNELVEFWDVRPEPSTDYTNRGFLLNIKRNRNGTTGAPTVDYDCQFYSGNTTDTLFALGQTITDQIPAIFVDDLLKQPGIDFNFVTVSGVEYVEFVNAPDWGQHNIKIVTQIADNSVSGLSHPAGEMVVDAGVNQLILPNYEWEPTPFGLQRSNSSQAVFLRNNRSNYESD